MEKCSSPLPVKSAHGQSRAANENTVTVYLPSSQSQQFCGENTKAITLSPQPLKLDVNTATDWPAVSATFFVGVTGALVALAVGGMAYLGQRSQVRAATANFRHDWQKELRGLVAKFISVAARIHYELESNPDYLSSSESNSEYSQLIETHAKIEMMLDRSKPYAKEISKISSRLIDAVKNHQVNQISLLSSDLLDVANGVLEQTWQDIRNDLRGKN